MSRGAQHDHPEHMRDAALLAKLSSTVRRLESVTMRLETVAQMEDEDARRAEGRQPPDRRRDDEEPEHG